VEFSLSALVFACAASLCLSIGAILWCALFSTPASIRKEVDSGRALARTAMEAVEQVEGKFVQHKAEIGALAEAIEGTLDSVERKRRQISGAASRLNAVPEVAPTSRQDIVDQARARVYGGNI